MMVAALATALGGVAAFVMLARRRRARTTEPEPLIAPEILPAALEPESESEPELGAGIRPALELDFAIARAGLDGEQLAAEFEIQIRNSGEARAHDVRLHVELRTANAQVELPAASTVTIDRPMVAPFVLEPGAEAQFTATVVLPAARIDRLMLAGRPMCVPLIVVSASYRWVGGGKAELGVDYLLGVAQPGNPRLGPIWLDVPPKMHDRIGMRLHGDVRKR